jgi:hypothetical protein
VDYSKITLKECEDNLRNFGQRVVIENGQVVELVKEEN